LGGRRPGLTQADLSSFESALAAFFISTPGSGGAGHALAVLGFSVVAAILLMRTRVRAANNDARLRSDLRDLQVEATVSAPVVHQPQSISWRSDNLRRSAAIRRC